MPNFQIYKNLAWLNDLPAEEAESVFRDCCGSHSWAKAMAAARPFPMIEALFSKAESIWSSLPEADWLEAFAAHPKIGDKKAAPRQQARSAEWSGGEQSGMKEAAETLRNELAEANRLYEDKFGFIFIVCATGRTADEMLAICRARFNNSRATEIGLAADEQRKITEIRMVKLLEQ